MYHVDESPNSIGPRFEQSIDLGAVADLGIFDGVRAPRGHHVENPVGE